jgi:DNA polymerase
VKYCVFDFETYSEAPLTKVGAFEYAAHPSTEVLCAAWQVLGEDRVPLGPIQSANVHGGDNLDALRTILATPGTIAVVHNLSFELAICLHVLGWDIDVENWEDTAVSASAYGLPRSLEKAAEALELQQKKSSRGAQLLRLLSKPGAGPQPEHLYDELVAYCEQDVATQVDLFRHVPPICDTDYRYWLANIRMNMRGFLIDRDFVTKAQSLLDYRYQEIDKEFLKITGISSANKTASTLSWLKARGYTADSLTKQDIGEFTSKSPVISRVLDLRSQRAKAAVKKYEVMLQCSAFDGRARDTTVFYGAHTGRDAAVRLQPHNMVKSSCERWEVDYFIDQVKAGVHFPSEETIPILSDCVRGAITAPEGRKLVVADFAQIELRVLFWIAGHELGLRSIREGRELYKEMAAIIYMKPVDQVTGNERQLGKQVVLGAGFGIGVNGIKFQAAAKAYGMDISLDLAQRAVRAYRQLHHPIPEMWKDIEDACIHAVIKKGKLVDCCNGKITVFCEEEGAPLRINLPSGRSLYYQKPKVTRSEGPYGPRYELTFYGVHGPARKFERRSTWGGTLTENVVQAIARDVMYEAKVRLEGVADVILGVHDEIITETPVAFDPAIVQNTMEVTPVWAHDLPINVEVWEGQRYGK